MADSHITKNALACNVESPETLQEAVSQLKGENHEGAAQKI